MSIPKRIQFKADWYRLIGMADKEIPVYAPEGWIGDESSLLERAKEALVSERWDEYFASGVFFTIERVNPQGFTTKHVSIRDCLGEVLVLPV